MGSDIKKKDRPNNRPVFFLYLYETNLLYKN